MADLVKAAEINDLDELRRFLELESTMSSDRNTPTDAMKEACNAAALNDHSEAVSMLVDAGCVFYDDEVISALEGESKNVFDTMIARGWDINTSMGHLGCPLAVAMGPDESEMVQFLLSRGADPNATQGNYTMLECAVCASDIPIIHALLDAGAKMENRSALPIAASLGREDVISFLLERGASVDALPNNDDYIYTHSYEKEGVRNALGDAAWQGYPGLVKLLLERGADPTIRDTKGRTALELARTGGPGYQCDESHVPDYESCIKILEEALEKTAAKQN